MQWCFCQFAAADLTPFEADNEIFVLPDATLDSAYGSLPANVRNLVKNRLPDAGIETIGINTSMTVREVLHYIVHQIQPGVNIEAGDVQDIEQ